MNTAEIKTVDITPSWKGILPTLIFFTKEKKPSVQKCGYDELNKMAAAADNYNEVAPALSELMEVVTRLRAGGKLTAEHKEAINTASKLLRRLEKRK